MVSLHIDNVLVNVAKNSTVLQACDSIGIDVPRFCFHERLLIAGNCRMCLVEIEKSPKPVASCALPVSEGMRVYTKTPLVKKAQEGVLEFLLLNHPLDCPICDQGGECDLQDQAMIFGSDSSRFYEYKRGVEDKDCGPLIKTIMTRCIHCTRCVRFLSEIGGVPDLGTLGRGTNTQIGTYLVKNLSSELSGNIIDLCPVGALTSKPYAFKARSWELKSINSVDVMDSCGSNIVVNVKGVEVMRVLPRLNENINEEWISDKTRFSYDGLKFKRLGLPLYLDSKFKRFNILKWEHSFNLFFSHIKKYIYNLDNNLNIIFGKEVDIETILTLKYFFNKLNCFSLYSEDNFCTNSSDLFYKLNCNMKNLEDHDLCILVNTNTRFEVSMLNLHLRKWVINGKLEVGFFGPFSDFTFKNKHLGLDINSFLNLIKGKHPFSKRLKKAKNPLFIINSTSFDYTDLLFINDVLFKNLGLLNNLNILNIDSGVTGSRELGIKGFDEFFMNYSLKKGYELNNLYINTNLNSRIIDFMKSNNTSSVYCGSHGVSEINNSFLVLPGKAFTEKKVSYINLEGLLQNSNVCSGNLVDSREEWKIFSAFFEYLKLNSSYSQIVSFSISDLYSFNQYFTYEFPFLKKLNIYNKNLMFNIKVKGNLFNRLVENKFYKSKIINFYRTNIISQNSKIMMKCSKIIKRLNF